LEYATSRRVQIALEPEPGMFIEQLVQFDRLVDRLAANHPLALTIDVGHLVVNESQPYERHIVERGDRLAIVHLDDAKRGVHEHLMIDEGDVDWPKIAGALDSVRFSGPAVVELSRHSHDAVRAARLAHQRLRSHGF
jgi:L-ribulose-5-phosphate 3-epimerase